MNRPLLSLIRKRPIAPTPPSPASGPQTGEGRVGAGTSHHVRGGPPIDAMEHSHAPANRIACDLFRHAAGRYPGCIGAIGIFVSLVQPSGPQWQYVLLLHQLGTMPSYTIRHRRQLHHEPLLSSLTAAPAARRRAPKIGFCPIGSRQRQDRRSAPSLPSPAWGRVGSGR